MENAFRHARNEVRITADLQPPATLIIDDDGQGIPAEISEHLLHRGVRADQRHPGEGIGLAVVSEILSQYGATLDIQDSPLGGARFSINFTPADLPDEA
jgi:two-component system, OmpR family, sensor histidine kinase PhoQ